jgi:hypothetical protein
VGHDLRVPEKLTGAGPADLPDTSSHVTSPSFRVCSGCDIADVRSRLPHGAEGRHRVCVLVLTMT